MSITPISEAHLGEFLFGSVITKEITDSNTGQKMVLRFIKVLYRNKHGKVVRPLFECPVHLFPRGIKLEDRKVKGFCVYDPADEDVLQMVETTFHTQKRGWLRYDKKDKSQRNIELVKDIDENTVSSNDGEIEILDKPNGNVLFTVPENESLIVITQKKAEGSAVWLDVKTRGIKGHFQKIHDMVSEVIFEHKDELNLSSKETVTQIENMVKHPVYFPKNKETGKYDDSKNPSSFPQFLYYKDATQENFADIIMPGSKEKLTVDDLKDVSFSCIPVLNMDRFLVSADRINPQTKIVSCVITKIEKIERMSLQQSTVDRLGVDEAQYKKNMAILKEARKKSEESPVASSSPSHSDEPSSSPEASAEDEDDIDAILNGGSKSEDVEIQLDNEFPEVPGLDD
jgi:hypothetical protein